MTKEEKIKEAWGELFSNLSDKTSEYILRNEGQVNIYLLPKEDRSLLLEDFDIRSYQSNFECTKTDEGTQFMFRPKYLQGIENNNGWVKIESEEDLPKLNGTYFTITRHDNKIRIEIIATQHLYKKDLEWYKNHYAYYQPIETPKLPIY